MDVLCVGQLCADVLVRPVERLDYGVDTVRVDGIDIRNGGDCLNVALGLSRLGLSVGFSGKVGTDMLGDYLAGVIAESGIDARGLRRTREAGTCACLVLINGKGDRSFFYRGGTNDLFGLEDIDLSLVAEAAVVHVGGTYLLPRLDGAGAAALFSSARSQGKITSMDVTWDTTGRWLSVIEPCLPHLSYFMPSIKEAEQIAGRRDPEGIAAFFLERGVGTVVIKLGDKGCYVKAAGKDGFSTGAFRANVVDTTGAGDSFVAGFLSGIIRGWALERCAALACAVAALNIQKVGATAGLPTFDEARRFMEDQGR
ncbi:MAG TPA: carbohydrate kinase family protein [Spirochaetia bacterium]|nr:carbohydrate kinase family protein [Spirochaetia bacterium]